MTLHSISDTNQTRSVDSWVKIHKKSFFSILHKMWYKTSSSIKLRFWFLGWRRQQWIHSISDNDAWKDCRQSTPILGQLSNHLSPNCPKWCATPSLSLEMERVWKGNSVYRIELSSNSGTIFIREQFTILCSINTDSNMRHVKKTMIGNQSSIWCTKSLRS